MRLIIRCPVRPVAISAEDWSAQDLYFSWAQSHDADFEKVLDLDALPVADSVLPLVRLGGKFSPLVLGSVGSARRPCSA